MPTSIAHRTAFGLQFFRVGRYRAEKPWGSLHSSEATKLHRHPVKEDQDTHYFSAKTGTEDRDTHNFPSPSITEYRRRLDRSIRLRTCSKSPPMRRSLADEEEDLSKRCDSRAI